jgi:hypothetical protein
LDLSLRVCRSSRLVLLFCTETRFFFGLPVRLVGLAPRFLLGLGGRRLFRPASFFSLATRFLFSGRACLFFRSPTRLVGRTPRRRGGGACVLFGLPVPLVLLALRFLLTGET